MKDLMNLYFTNYEIQNLANEAVSVRNGNSDVFMEVLKKLMNACYDKGWSDGYEDKEIEDEEAL